MSDRDKPHPSIKSCQLAIIILLANDFTVAGNSWDLITITYVLQLELCDSHVVQTLQSQLNSSIGLLQLARHCVN